jgi:hypothetical protein
MKGRTLVRNIRSIKRGGLARKKGSKDKDTLVCVKRDLLVSKETY